MMDDLILTTSMKKQINNVNKNFVERDNSKTSSVTSDTFMKYLKGSSYSTRIQAKYIVEGSKVVCSCASQVGGNNPVMSKAFESIYAQNVSQLNHKDITFLPVFSKCNTKNAVYREPEKCEPIIEKNEWQGYDESNRVGSGYGLDKNTAYMICTKGPGIIYVTDDGQRNAQREVEIQEGLEDSGENDYFVIIARGNLTVRDSASSSGQELAKLSPGSAIKIVTPKNVKHDGTRSWIEVKYDTGKTGWIAEEYIHPNVQVITDFSNGNYGQITGQVDGNSKTLNALEKWGIAGGGEYGSGEATKDSQGRYEVAVGPRIIYQDYPNNGQCQTEDFSGFSRYLEVELEHKTTGTAKTIKCVISDVKAHTYSKYPDAHKDVSSMVNSASFSVENGIVQTGIRYPQASNELVVGTGNMDGSVIEFRGGKFRDFKLTDYKIVRVISNVKRTDLFIDQI